MYLGVCRCHGYLESGRVHLVGCVLSLSVTWQLGNLDSYRLFSLTGSLGMSGERESQTFFLGNPG